MADYTQKEESSCPPFLEKTSFKIPEVVEAMPVDFAAMPLVPVNWPIDAHDRLLSKFFSSRVDAARSGRPCSATKAMGYT